MIFVELQSRIKSTILNEGSSSSDDSSDLTVFDSKDAAHSEKLPFNIEDKIISMLNSLPGVKSLGGYAVLIKGANSEEPASIQVIVNSKFPKTPRFIDAIVELEDDLNSEDYRDTIFSLPMDIYRISSKEGIIPDDDEIITMPII